MEASGQEVKVRCEPLPCGGVDYTAFGFGEARISFVSEADARKRLLRAVGVSPMMVYLASSGVPVGWLAGRFPGQVGQLLTPDKRPKPHAMVPFALDNGAFGSWKNKRPFDAERFRRMVAEVRLLGLSPNWLAVPDVVCDPVATVDFWHEWHDECRATGWPLAFVAQDGHEPRDVPDGADVVFVGGSPEWKWRTVGLWCREFRRVHVGRVSSPPKLWHLSTLGPESCDGTGWTRGDQRQWRGLVRYLEGRGDGQKTLLDIHETK